MSSSSPVVGRLVDDLVERFYALGEHDRSAFCLLAQAVEADRERASSDAVRRLLVALGNVAARIELEQGEAVRRLEREYARSELDGFYDSTTVVDERPEPEPKPDEREPLLWEGDYG